MEGREDAHGLDKDHYSTNIQKQGRQTAIQELKKNIITMHRV